MSLGFDLVHVLLSYSKRPDLAMDLSVLVDRLHQYINKYEKNVRVSVQSEHPPRMWRIDDRFSEAELRTLVANFEAGMSLMQLAAQYGISRSSIKRLLKARGVSRK